MALVNGTNGNDVIDFFDGVSLFGDTINAKGGDDTIFGFDGNDFIEGGQGADWIHGGSGSDSATYADSDEGVIVNLDSGTGHTGDAQGDTLISIENLTGSAHADILSGDDNVNVLNGMGGNDVLKGGGGADTLYGGTGSDTASYYGSSSHVFVSLIHDAANGGDAAGDELNSIENLDGSSYNDSLWGDDQVNMLRGMDGHDTLKGYGGNDKLYGGDGNDELWGMEGADILYGENNNDTLLGGAGFDKLYGGNGNDVLIGGEGQDTMFGGAGADIFKISSLADAPVAAYGFTDYLPDFVPGQDKIDLSKIDAIAGTAADDKFSPIGIDVAFNGVAGELRFNGGFLEGDVNGDAVADFRIELDVASLTAATDLVL